MKRCPSVPVQGAQRGDGMSTQVELRMGEPRALGFAVSEEAVTSVPESGLGTAAEYFYQRGALGQNSPPFMALGVPALTISR
jgi:hypothetical protein